MSGRENKAKRKESGIFSDNIVKDKNNNWIKPMTKGQRSLIKSIQQNKVTFALGPAGTGKSFLGMCIGLQMLRDGEVDKIVLTRPAVETGQGLGFLPGDVTEKYEPYLKPFFDAMDIILNTAEKKKFKDKIELAPLGFLRGSTQRCYLILDEAQNCTLTELQMLITRLGEGGKFVINGDPEQSDIKNSGLRQTVNALKQIEGIGYHEMGVDDIVRDEIIKEAILAFRKLKTDLREKK